MNKKSTPRDREFLQTGWALTAARFFLAVCTALSTAQLANAMTPGSQLVEQSQAFERWTQNPDAANFNDAIKATYFMGYVRAVSDVMTAATTFCPGKDMTIGQISSIVSKHLKDKPEHWDLPAPALVSNALKPVKPCK